ncbi:MAG: DUF3106 domain-containing protein [Acidobacteria bacterium]|nr:DUF3106 domain-containing protein [Acidobacteriota bacterium]MCL5287759.1 DUF3106 domain-containing protein [Acidobacteriota bacterium]
MKVAFKLAGMVAVALLSGALAEPALAQRGRGQAQKKKQPQAEQMRPPQTPPPAGQQRGAGPGGPGGPGKAFMPGRGAGPGGGMPPQWLERLHQMSPQDQERFMNNNQRFRNLPPQRQAEIRQRLRRWNNMTPEQRNRIRQIEENWRRLSPEDRQRVRQELMPKLQELPPQRRQGIMRRLGALHGMTDEERVTRLNDPAFLQGLSADEQHLLRELARLRIAPGAPQEPPPQDDNPPFN